MTLPTPHTREPWHTGPSPCDFKNWSAQFIDPVMVLRFHLDPPRDNANANHHASLWEFFESLSACQHKVLYIDFPQGYLGHDGLVSLWEYLRLVAIDKNRLAHLELIRYDFMMQRFINYVRDDKRFVIGAFTGEVDINYLGLMLACDYRIASKNTVIVSAGRPLGVGVGTAVPWFLNRILGQAQMLEVLLGDENLTAQHAHDLGIIHHLTDTSSHTSDSMEFTQSLVSKGIANLLTLKRAVSVSSESLEEYLHVIGAGFRRLPIDSPTCENCGYNLTGNTSGRCPECGRDIPTGHHPQTGPS